MASKGFRKTPKVVKTNGKALVKATRVRNPAPRRGLMV